jgi:RNA polymerase sigma-70 factor (ECF subfamily)
VDLEDHRRDLTGLCYRMLGSAFDADDAVQETMVRAWKSHDRFEGRAALRTWLHRIATNVCLDMLASRSRRLRAMDLGLAGSPDGPIPDVLPRSTWILPIPDDRALPQDPAEQLSARYSTRTR